MPQDLAHVGCLPGDADICAGRLAELCRRIEPHDVDRDCQAVAAALRGTELVTQALLGLRAQLEVTPAGS